MPFERGRFITAHAVPAWVPRDRRAICPRTALFTSPVRIPRDPHTRQSPTVAGLYPCGEGAGFAGGIVSAAVDGLRTARAIVARYARPTPAG